MYMYLQMASIMQIWINKSSKEFEIIYQNQSISVFLDIAKFSDFQWKNADVNRTQGVCHLIHIFFGSSLGKV